MANDPSFDHEFLDLRAEGLDERTFLGRYRMSTRYSMFVAAGLLAIVAFGALYVYVDRRASDALDSWRLARQVSVLVNRIETGVAQMEAHEKQFLLDKQQKTTVNFRREVQRVEFSLDALNELPDATTVRQHIATLRDGLAQYDQQFGQVVEVEKAISSGSAGSAAGSARSRLNRTTGVLTSGFKDIGFANLADQVMRIVREGDQSIASGARFGVEEIRQRYRTLEAFLKTAEKVSKKDKAVLGNAIKAHETDLLALIERRFALDTERGRFNEILSYVAPSLEGLAEFSRALTKSAGRRLELVQTSARYTVGTGSAAILLWLILAGLVLMRTLIAPVRATAEAAARLASGDRGAPISGRGNIDASGQIARALDKWIDDLIEMDAVRRELDQTQAKLEFTVRQAERDAEAAMASAADAARSALLSRIEPAAPKVEAVKQPAQEAALGSALGSVPEPTPVPTSSDSAPEPTPQNREAVDPRMAAFSNSLSSAAGIGGPISSVSKQLAHYSDYVTAAAHDVEQTEAMIRGLSDASGHVEILGNLVVSVRDQINMLAFRSAPRPDRDRDPDNLIPFNGEERQSLDIQGSQDPTSTGRFEAVREATERADRTVQALRSSMENITTIAQDVATTASTQALEATGKLLSQSQYLQSMLDDIMARIHPAVPGRLSAPDQNDKTGNNGGS